MVQQKGVKQLNVIALPLPPFAFWPEDIPIRHLHTQLPRFRGKERELIEYVASFYLPLEFNWLRTRFESGLQPSIQGVYCIWHLSRTNLGSDHWEGGLRVSLLRIFSWTFS